MHVLKMTEIASGNSWSAGCPCRLKSSLGTRKYTFYFLLPSPNSPNSSNTQLVPKGLGLRADTKILLFPAQARHDGGGGALGSVLHRGQRQGPGLGHPGVDTAPQQHREEEK